MYIPIFSIRMLMTAKLVSSVFLSSPKTIQKQVTIIMEMLKSPCHNYLKTLISFLVNLLVKIDKNLAAEIQQIINIDYKTNFRITLLYTL